MAAGAELTFPGKGPIFNHLQWLKTDHCFSSRPCWFAASVVGSSWSAVKAGSACFCSIRPSIMKGVFPHRRCFVYGSVSSCLSRSQESASGECLKCAMIRFRLQWRPSQHAVMEDPGRQLAAPYVQHSLNHRLSCFPSPYSCGWHCPSEPRGVFKLE